MKNLTYKGGFTSDVEKNRSEIIFFLGFIVEFFWQVVASMSDVERRKVKRYFFSQGADLTVRGSTQVVARQCTTPCLQGVWLSDIGRMAEVRNVPHLALQGVSTGFVLIGYILLCVISMILTPCRARCGTFLPSAICH